MSAQGIRTKSWLLYIYYVGGAESETSCCILRKVSPHRVCLSSAIACCQALSHASCYALQLSDNGFDLLKSAGDTFPVVCASADRLLLIQAASMEDERNLDTAGAAPKR